MRLTTNTAMARVFRSQMLVNQLNAQLALHGGLLTRSNVVQAMEGAASQDLDGLAVLPLLLQYLTGHPDPASTPCSRRC